MQIDVDYTLWNKEHTKIKHFKTLKISEEDIIELLIQKYNEDGFAVPIHLNKDELIVEFDIRGGTF